ncbi:DNA-3-methyladenine glycosylase [Herbiconiux sp. CPCC 205763]|uniref:Putative 3-methyladenine DNA glycosylase n=1 Tax=Herbiconiux aconitum TaxID=2970913 RepID=A0ABT2GVV2_9MICO|nr:DNA-3-methyladenine glycosylase [Herbiconiux aconitum]MCS5720339.1 DNA-3-methyladenine glycosylase [Herbiconiux aconitum]
MVVRGYRKTDRGFFERDVLEVAPDLLGCVLKKSDDDGAVAIRITEVEAYAGERDPGAHSFRGRTARNATMFGPAGHIYCYFTYGLHHAINLVTTGADRPYGCLVRAGLVIEGQHLARARRAARRRSPVSDRELARGPGNVAQVFDVTLADNGDDLFGGAWEFLVADAPRDFQPAVGPRVGVSGRGGDAGEFPWRFWIPGDPTVSAYRPGKPV